MTITIEIRNDLGVYETLAQEGEDSTIFINSERDERFDLSRSRDQTAFIDLIKDAILDGKR